MKPFYLKIKKIKINRKWENYHVKINGMKIKKWYYMIFVKMKL